MCGCLGGRHPGELLGLRSLALGRLCPCLLAVAAAGRVAGGDLLGLGSCFTIVCPIDACLSKYIRLVALRAGAVASLAGGGEGDCGHGLCDGDGAQSDGVGGVYVSEEALRARSDLFPPWRLGFLEGDLGGGDERLRSLSADLDLLLERLGLLGFSSSAGLGLHFLASLLLVLLRIGEPGTEPLGQCSWETLGELRGVVQSFKTCQPHVCTAARNATFTAPVG